MTVTSEVSKVVRPGTGLTSTFTYDPPIDPPDDLETELEVYHVDVNGVETLLVLGTGPTNYSLNLNTVIYPADSSFNIPATESILIKRVLPFKQETALDNRGGYIPSVQENQFDRFTQTDQQQQEDLDRSIKIPSSYEGPLDTETDTPSAGPLYLRISSDETALEWAALSTTTASAGDTVAQDVSLSAGAAGTDPDFSREDHVHLLPTVTVAKGGTGATDAATARTNLAVIGDTGDQTITTGDLTLTSTDVTNAVGPDLILDRQSVSPAVADDIGRILFKGKNSLNNNVDYASIFASILDQVSGTEDGEVNVQTIVNNVLANRITIADGMYMAGATGSDQGAGTFNAQSVYDDGNQIHALQDGLNTVVDATNSGANDLTQIDFTSIRSDAHRITVMFENVSATGTDAFYLQLGASGGIENTGYGGSIQSGSGVSQWPTSAASLSGTSTAAALWSGVAILELMDATNHVWVIHTNMGRSDSTSQGTGAGRKTLSGTLDRVRVLLSGANTFDNGNVNIRVE